MSNTYKTRSMFDIAENEEKKVFLCGVWYRHSATEYVVFHASKPRTFDNLHDALDYFEEMTK